MKIFSIITGEKHPETDKDLEKNWKLNPSSRHPIGNLTDCITIQMEGEIYANRFIAINSHPPFFSSFGYFLYNLLDLACCCCVFIAAAYLLLDASTAVSSINVVISILTEGVDRSAVYNTRGVQQLPVRRLVLAIGQHWNLNILVNGRLRCESCW